MELIVDGVRNYGGGLLPIKIRVTYPKKWKVTIVESFDDYSGYKWFSGKPEEVEWEYVFTQAFTKHCNGYPIYWQAKFNRLAINKELQVKRGLNVGEAWSCGDNID